MQSENSKIDIPPTELVALATSLALALAQKYSCSDLLTIRNFLSCLCANLSLYDYQFKKTQKDKMP